MGNYCEIIDKLLVKRVEELELFRIIFIFRFRILGIDITKEFRYRARAYVRTRTRKTPNYRTTDR